MGWTSWRLLAQGQDWFDEEFDNEGPCCYELGTGGPRGGSIRQHYVGETANERKRMSEYGRDGSHLSKIIRWHLREGWCLYYRSWAVNSKAQAFAKQNALLAQYEYDWNTQLNQED
jgi:GIY-YIG domain-containing protein